MKFNVRLSETNPDLSVMSLTGRLGIQAVEELGAGIYAALAECPAGLILDLAQVDFISSAGLRELVVAHQQAESAGKKLGIIRVQPSVYKIFKLTAFDSEFNIFKGETEAVKALSG